MTASKAQLDATNRFNAKRYDNLRIVIPKGRKKAVEADVKSKGLKINTYVNTLIREDMGFSEAEWEKRD